MKRPLYRPRARADLRRIAIESLSLFGELQARTYLDRLDMAALDIAMDRRRGRPFDDATPDYRRLLVGAHYLIYRRRDDGRVVVVRVLHSRMDLSSHL